MSGEKQPGSEHVNSQDFLRQKRDELSGLSVFEALSGPVKTAVSNDVDLQTLDKAMKLAETVKELSESAKDKEPSARTVSVNIDATISALEKKKREFKHLPFEDEVKTDKEEKKNDEVSKPATKEDEGAKKLEGPIKNLQQAVDTFNTEFSKQKSQSLLSVVEDLTERDTSGKEIPKAGSYKEFFKDLSKYFYSLMNRKGDLEDALNLVSVSHPDSSAFVSTTTLLQGTDRIINNYRDWVKNQIEYPLEKEIQAFVARTLTNVEYAAIEANLDNISRSIVEFEQLVKDTLAGKRLTPAIDSSIDIRAKLEELRDKVSDKRAEIRRNTGPETGPSTTGTSSSEKDSNLRRLIAEIQSLDEAYDDSKRDRYIFLHDELVKVRDEIILEGRSPASVDQSFSSALAKINQFYEIVKVYQMNWEQLAKEVLRLNLETKSIFSEISASTAQKVKDPTVAVINRFQSSYFKEEKEEMLKTTPEHFLPTGLDTRGMSRNKIIEIARDNYYFWRTYTWVSRYNADHPIKGNIPGTAQNELYVSIASLNSVDSLYEGVTNHELYGPTIRELLDYAILFMANRVPSRDPSTLGVLAKDITVMGEKKGLDYGGINRVNGIEDFRKHLAAVFVGTGPGKLPQEMFESAWHIYKAFDLPSISLRLLQAETQTQSHNINSRYNYIDDSGTPQKLDFDVLFNCYVFHSTEHKNGRYGKGKSAWNIMYMFSGTPPSEKWVNSEQVVLDEDGHKMWITTNAERQELLNKYYSMFFSINGINNKIHPDEATTSEDIFGKPLTALSVKERKVFEMLKDGPTLEDWDKPLFPDVNMLIQGEAGATDLAMYAVALQGWNKMLNLIASPIEPFSDIERVTDDTSGLLWEMTANGIGLAKLMTGLHRKLFVPMLRLYIGRLGMAYTSSKASDRLKLQEEIVKSLNNAKKYGLKIDDPVFKKELNELIHELEHGSNELSYSKGWQRNILVMVPGFSMRGVSDILLPRNTLKGLFRKERVEFAKKWWEVATRNEKNGETPFRPKYFPRWLLGLGPALNVVLRGAYPIFYADKHKPEVHLYNAIINGTFTQHELKEIENVFINKKNKDTDTSATAGKKH